MEKEKKVLLMTEEYWMSSQLSIARFYGGININGCEYVIVNKDGLDLFECSKLAEKEGREKAIEPGEPADLIPKTLVKAYKKLGRDEFIKRVEAGATEKELIESTKNRRKKNGKTEKQ